jgi:hypothetical protein
MRNGIMIGQNPSATIRGRFLVAGLIFALSALIAAVGDTAQRRVLAEYFTAVW